jgi:arabinofuranan 3-O-arabinosyltransferase
MSASSERNARPTRGIRHALELVGFAMALAYVLFLAASLHYGYWLYDAAGQSIDYDFVAVWAAGALTLAGNPAAAYDWTAHRAIEAAAVGHDFASYYGWHYPPPFLAPAAALAMLPYLAAMLVWLGLTLPAYLAAIRAIMGDRLALVLGCAFPGVLWNSSAGQNGFLTAALLGGMLVNLERRPLVSGVLLGLLTYKPQFGILFPLVLAFDGRWRVLIPAAATAGAMAAGSLLAFGVESWRAFFEWMPVTSAAVFADGRAGLNKLQSLFGVVRWLGGGMTTAMLAQGLLIAGATAALIAVNRRNIDGDIKKAALAVAALLATPYLYIYDFAVLAIALAYLMRLGLRHGFLPFEAAAIALACALVLMFPFVAVPTGFAAAVVVAAAIAVRAAAPASHRATAMGTVAPV